MGEHRASQNHLFTSDENYFGISHNHFSVVVFTIHKSMNFQIESNIFAIYIADVR